MAHSSMARLCVALAIALCFVGAATATSYSIRDISGLVGNRTIQLKLESGGYLNAVGTAVGVSYSATDTSTYWQLVQYKVQDMFDKSVFVYHPATSKYLTYFAPIISIPGTEGIFLQSPANVVLGRWWFYEINTSSRYVIGNTFNFFYYVSFTESNSQSDATAFSISPVLPSPSPPPASPPPPSPPPPSPPPPSSPPPPIFSQATIQSLEFPHVYLHTDGNKTAADGVGKLVDLQYTLDKSNRYELVLQPNKGEDVYAIRNIEFNLYVRLDPTEFPDQVPEPGSTFHPNGLGRSSAVAEIDDYCIFQLIVNLHSTASPPDSCSFRLINTTTALYRNIYLRLDGTRVADGKSNGVVNGQTLVSRSERLLVERYSSSSQAFCV